jgi:hypothetical protein
MKVCSQADPYLYIRISGTDLDLPKRDPDRLGVTPVLKVRVSD